MKLYLSFTNNTGIIQEHINNNKITIDPVSGTISITADNTLAPGNYKINVKVVGPTEDKGEATTTVVLEIKANPNKFTLYYGNNIGLNTVQHANQFAYSSKDEMDNAELIPTVNFLTNTTTPNIKWEYANCIPPAVFVSKAVQSAPSCELTESRTP